MKKIILLISLISLISLLSSQTVFASTAVTLDAYDTMVGFGTVVKASGLVPNQLVALTLTSPSGNITAYTPMVNSVGSISYDIEESSTSESGKYVIGLPKYNTQSTFMVYPLNSIGGDPILLAQAGGTVTQLIIDGTPASVTSNQTFNIRVTAADNNGMPVPSYRGTILFASTDPNARLPARYTFQASDQGRKTFDLGASLSTSGTQRITVQEDLNALVKGEKDIQVMSVAGGAVNAQIRITKPATGTYSVNTLEVAGETTPNVRVRLYDKAQQIAEVTSNSTGRFSHNTTLLSDGQHVFMAETNGVQSAPVVITIDSTPARVENVQIAESTLAPGASTTITVRSDPDLTSVQAAIGDVIVELNPVRITPGLYSGTITAPAREGVYTINVFITDRVGNVSPAQEVGRIQVDSTLQHDGSLSFSVPSKVTNVRTTAGKNSVLLGWAAAQAEAGVSLYRVFYGTDISDLNLVATTKGPETQMVLTNLENGKDYFFEVVAVDNNNNESDNRSDTVTAKPYADGPVFTQNGNNFSSNQSGDALNGSLGSPALCDSSYCEANVASPVGIPEDGPGVVGMVIASLVSAGGISIVRRRGRLL